MSRHIKPIAVIDIGSNSVRLVVYDGLERSPQTLFNEKVMCGLGKMLSVTGRMSDESVENALATLTRFSVIIRDMGCKIVRAMATAAVRDAENGPDFIADVAARTGLEVDVLDGAEEARYSALGVLSGIPDAEGIVGDLGGGSLELIRISGGKMHERVTLPIGPIRLMGDPSAAKPKLRKIIDKSLKSVEWLRSYPGVPIYIVGGAWRALARIHMQRTNYPLQILHQYEMDAEAVHKTYRLVRRVSPDDLRQYDKVPARRLETLPVASRILDRLVTVAGASGVVVSALGLREGILYEQLDEDVRARDPLIGACRQTAWRNSRFQDHSAELMAWMEPLFEDMKESEEQKRLRLATTLMSDISWRGHPDFRAERAIYESLFGWFVAIDAPGRAAMGLALFINYGANASHPLGVLAQSLLSDAQIAWANRLGYALRLAHRLSAGTPAPLEGSRLKLTKNQLGLILKPEARGLYGEVVERRLVDLARACGVESAGLL